MITPAPGGHVTIGLNLGCKRLIKVNQSPYSSVSPLLAQQCSRPRALLDWGGQGNIFFEYDVGARVSFIEFLHRHQDFGGSSLSRIGREKLVAWMAMLTLLGMKGTVSLACGRAEHGRHAPRRAAEGSHRALRCTETASARATCAGGECMRRLECLTMQGCTRLPLSMPQLHTPMQSMESRLACALAPATNDKRRLALQQKTVRAPCFTQTGSHRHQQGGRHVHAVIGRGARKQRG